MAFIVSTVSQKGGVGKSTLARIVAREFAAQEWEVKIADVDVSQGTSFRWASRRLQNGISPDIPVQQYGDISKVLKDAELLDLVVVDGAPHATRMTEQIAKKSDLVIIPTGPCLDDLEPSVNLANELKKKGIEKARIAFALCRTGTDSELFDAQEYLGKTPFDVLEGYLPDRTSYRRATDEGYALTEIHFTSLRELAEKLAQSIVDKISDLNS